MVHKSDTGITYLINCRIVERRNGFGADEDLPNREIITDDEIVQIATKYV